MLTYLQCVRVCVWFVEFPNGIGTFSRASDRTRLNLDDADQIATWILSIHPKIPSGWIKVCHTVNCFVCHFYARNRMNYIKNIFTTSSYGTQVLRSLSLSCFLFATTHHIRPHTFVCHRRLSRRSTHFNNSNNWKSYKVQLSFRHIHNSVACTHAHPCTHDRFSWLLQSNDTYRERERKETSIQQHLYIFFVLVC